MPGTDIKSTTYVREPQQERSRVTMRRILLATEELLGQHLLEDITLNDILGRSGVSVGAFYARFSGVDALVPALYDPTTSASLTVPGRFWPLNAGKDGSWPTGSTCCFAMS